jgi:hypothetical protein
MKSDKPTRKPHRACYQQGKRKIYVEPLEDRLAVRYSEDAKESVRNALRSLGEVKSVESQRLLIVELSAPADESLKTIQEMVDRGEVEFFTPVLLDEKSRLHQILTDEISVRFKTLPPAKQLREMARKYGVTIARQNEFAPNQFIVRAIRSSGLDTLDVASRLDSAEEVEFATPNFISEIRR